MIGTEGVWSGERLGYWSSENGWQTEQLKSEAGNTCGTLSASFKAGRETYKIAFLVGEQNEFVFLSDVPVQKTEDFAIEFEGGGGYDLMAASVKTTDNVSIVRNALSGSMMGKILRDFRSVGAAYVRIDGGVYPVSLGDFENTYATIKKCENHRLGRILED